MYKRTRLQMIDCIKNLYFVSWLFKYIMNDIIFWPQDLKIFSLTVPYILES